MVDELDGLIEEAAIYGELSSGTPTHWLKNHADARTVAVLAAGEKSRRGKAAQWTPEEEQFVQENFRHMSNAELGQALGRTAEAVSIYCHRHLKSLPSRSHDPELPTARAVARMLGMGCAKSVVRLIRSGLLPGRRLPVGGIMWGVPREAVARFAINPENWIYFRPEQVRAPHLRRLIQLRKARWQDEWWSLGQVAAYHGVSTNGVNKCIHEGRLPAKKWGNFWVKRSDAVALQIAPGGGFHEEIGWTEAGDAFLVLARALGFSQTAIGVMCGWQGSRVAFRLKTLHERQAIPRLIQKRDLAVQYDPESGNVFADWRNYRRRFRRLATANERFVSGSCQPSDLRVVAYTLQTWAQWHATNEEQRYAALRLRHGSNLTEASLRAHLNALRTRGIDPLAIKHGRCGMAVELNPTYYEACVDYCRQAEVERQTPKLFELEEA